MPETEPEPAPEPVLAAEPAPKTERQLRPLDPPTVPFAIGGMAIWAVIGVIFLAFRHTLSAHGHTDWLWICLAGFVAGFPGLLTMIVHDRHRRQRRAELSAAESDPIG